MTSKYITSNYTETTSSHSMAQAIAKVLTSDNWEKVTISQVRGKRKYKVTAEKLKENSCYERN